MISCLRYVLSFSVAGTILALMLNALWSLHDKDFSHQVYSLLFKLTLMIFPASIGTMGISGSSYWTLDFFALLGLNAIFYAALGLLTWLGVFKHKVFIVIELLIILEIWRRIIILQ